MIKSSYYRLELELELKVYNYRWYTNHNCVILSETYRTKSSHKSHTHSVTVVNCAKPKQESLHYLSDREKLVKLYVERGQQLP